MIRLIGDSHEFVGLSAVGRLLGLNQPMILCRRRAFEEGGGALRQGEPTPYTVRLRPFHHAGKPRAAAEEPLRKWWQATKASAVLVKDKVLRLESLDSPFGVRSAGGEPGKFSQSSLWD